MKKFIEAFVSIAVLATAGLFIWQNHNRDVNARTNYDGDDVAIVRPVNLADTAYKICETKRVSDGDTIAVNCDGEELKLRFCGIDAPESKQPLGAESKALMVKLTDGKQVFVRPIEKDRFGRTVAQVEVKGDRLVNGQPEIIFVNGEMVSAGLAYHYAQYSANCPNRYLIVEAEAIAKDEKLGVWGEGNFVKPWDYRKARKSAK